MNLYDKLPPETRDAILTEAAAYSTMMEGMNDSAAMLWEKAAKLRAAQEGATKMIPERLS